MGSNFIRYLYHKYGYCHIFNLDALTYSGNMENLRDIEHIERNKKNKRYEFIKGNICNAKLISNLFKKYKFDAVINFAADTHVDRSIINAKHFVETNVTGLNTLVSFVKEYKIKRFIQISTDEVYGDKLTGNSSENDAFRPSNPYAASKAAADLLAQSYIRTHGLPILIIRGSNNFGPYQYPEKLIPLAITNVLLKEKVPIHGDGMQVRSWIHTQDFASAIDLVLHQAKDYSIYNVSGKGMTNLEIIRKIFKAAGENYSDFIDFVKDRPGGDRRYSPSSKKIKRDLGWTIEYPVDDYIKDTFLWYRENNKWWERIRDKNSFKHHYQKQKKSEY